MNVHQRIHRKEVKKAIDKLKCDKSAGVDGITAEMFKCEGERVVECTCM